MEEVSIYNYYEIEKLSLINLAKSFNKIRKKMEKSHIDYSDFDEYYTKYFEAVVKNTLGFDYITYGYSLLNADVKTKSKEELEKYNKQRLALSKYLATYVVKQELDRIVNPNEIYTAMNSKKM